MKTYKGYLTGTRWQGLKEFLYDLAYSSGVDIKITDEDKGLIRTTVFYEVLGDESSVNSFRLRLAQTIDSYNAS